MFKSVETGELKNRVEWLDVLGCNVDRFNYMIKKGLYIKE